MRSCSDIVIVAELASRRKNAEKDRLVPYITLSSVQSLFSLEGTYVELVKVTWLKY